MKGTASQSISGTNDVNRQDKYKKMIQKYQNDDHLLFNKREKNDSPIYIKEEKKANIIYNPPQSPRDTEESLPKNTSFQKHKKQSSTQVVIPLDLQKKANAPANSVV